MENNTETQKLLMRMPDPPAYYKQFTNSSADLAPPDLAELTKGSKNYQLSFFKTQNITVTYNYH